MMLMSMQALYGDHVIVVHFTPRMRVVPVAMSVSLTVTASVKGAVSLTVTLSLTGTVSVAVPGTVSVTVKNLRLRILKYMICLFT